MATKLNDELIENMRQARHDGLNVTDSCAVCGISRETHYQWVKQGTDAVKKNAKPIRTNAAYDI